ncbi:AraC family transcriptional regulator [uncultured Sulfitobacter sp.]|uniref:AraC family transcriptional regulator n=1 Tax=uncultured Sulfitobacter sp. TaxID=191468 RepID=UPI0034137B29
MAKRWKRDWPIPSRVVRTCRQATCRSSRYPALIPPSVKDTNARIQRAVNRIKAHLADSMSVAKLAGLANMSISWFSRAFKATVGQSVHA